MTKYKPLKDFVSSRTPGRLAHQAGVRDALVEMAVAEYPLDAPPDRAVEVLQARMRLRIKERYGSIIAILLISVLSNLIARAVWEWIQKRRSHRELVSCWQEQLRASQG